MSPTAQRLALTLLLVLGTACSTQSDESLRDTIGVTQLFLVDPAQAPQSLSDPDGRIQAEQWQLQRAELQLGGLALDLLFGDVCTFSDTILITPFAQGPCSDGIVIDASDERSARLSIELTSMTVTRAEPVRLGFGGDHDGDGVPDDGDGSGAAFDSPCGLNGQTAGCDDNCPLVHNPDQADNDRDGVGNACTTIDPFFGVASMDSDADGVADASDNCVWVANPLQENTTGLSAEGIPDQIGDACREQTARVEVLGGSVIDLGTVLLTQPLNEISFLTLDFNNERTLQCDWDAEVCFLDPGRVRFCAQNSLAAARLGC